MNEFLRVSIDLPALAAQTARYGEAEMLRRLAEGVRLGMDRANLSVLGRAMKERFTGQGPFAVSQRRLGVRTGLLRRSLRATSATVADALNLRVLSKVGSKVQYFGPHEFGFRGSVGVQPHTRRTKKGGRASVKGHTRKMNIPARRPLRTAFGSQAAEAVYRREIPKAVIATMKRK